MQHCDAALQQGLHFGIAGVFERDFAELAFSFLFVMGGGGERAKHQKSGCSDE
jgi:hypothetical protein